MCNQGALASILVIPTQSPAATPLLMDLDLLRPLLRARRASDGPRLWTWTCRIVCILGTDNDS